MAGSQHGRWLLSIGMLRSVPTQLWKGDPYHDVTTALAKCIRDET